MICVWRAHIEGQAGAKELLAMSSGSCSPLPRKHGGHCVQHALWLALAGAKAFLTGRRLFPGVFAQLPNSGEYAHASIS